nr:HEAT repeat domain-containing protein [uncultured Methanoregula sp.]
MGVFDLFKQDDPDSICRRDVDRLMQDLRSDKAILVQEAIDGLQARGRAGLVPLLERLRVEDEAHKMPIVCVLLGLSGVTPAEICRSTKTTCHLENSELIHLFSLPGRNAIPGLLKYLTDNDGTVRSVAAGALARIGEPAHPLLVKALTHRSHRVRSGAADALARMNRVPSNNDDYYHFLIARERWSDLVRAKKAAVPFLIGILPDRYYRIRMDAATALGAIGDPRAVRPLGELLADPENEVCISAIEALGKIHNETAIPHLVRGLSHDSYNVRHMAATTLSACGWLPDTTEERARFYLASEQWHELSRMGRPAIPFLIQVLENPRYGLQAGVAAALKGMGKPGRDALVAAASHKNPVIRKAAEDILNESHSPAPGSAGPAHQDPVKAVVLPQGNKGPANTIATHPDPHLKSSEQPASCQAAPEQQGRDRQPHRSEPAGQDTSPAPVPVAQRVLSEIPKTRKPELPAPSTASVPEPHEREPDFSGCLQEGIQGTDTTEEEIRSLVAALKNKDGNIRAITVEALGRIGVRAIQALEGALTDPSWEVRLAAAEVLGQIKNERAVQPLITALHDTDGEVRAASACSLGKIGDFSAFVPLVQALEDPDFGARRNAESALAAFGEQGAQPAKRLLAHSNPLVRGSAATILGMIGSMETLPDLIFLFGDSDEGVRERAAIALGKTGSRAIPLLSEVLATGDPGRRLCAVTGLGHAGPGAEEYLVAACRDEDTTVRERARAFLTAASGSTPVSDTSHTSYEGFWPALPDDSPSHPGISAGEKTKAFAGETSNDANEIPGSEEGLPDMAGPLIGPLIDALKSPSSKTRMLAVQSLGRIGDCRAVSPLITLLGERDPIMRQIAAEALGQIGDTGAIPGLIRLLEDPFEQVRKSAASALGGIGHDDAVPGLIAALTDDDYSVRTEAGNILVRMGTLACPHLVLALVHPSRKIRRESASCLDQLGWGPEASQDRIHYLIAKEAWIELSGMEEAALPPLRRLVLASEEEDLRMGAILTLVKMENTHAIGLLIQALRDKSFLIRHKAMNALMDKGESAISPLMEATNSDDEHIRAASELILERITRRCSA